MSEQASEWDKYLLGSVLFASMLIGGGTGSGLYTDTLIEIAAIGTAAAVLCRASGQKIAGAVLWLPVLAAGLFVLQLIPLPESFFIGIRPEVLLGNPWVLGETRPVSISAGRTIECLLYFGATVVFFWAILRLRVDQVRALLPFFFVGVISNALAGAIQYSLADDVSIDGILPFTINAGFFANQNHFSALLFVSIPFVVYNLLFRGHLLFASFSLIGLLVLLLAAGSRAGVVIGLAITIISIVFLSARSRIGGIGVFLLFVVLCVYTVGAWATIDAKDADPAFGRSEFAHTTIEGLRDNWVIGVGFGNFQKAYQIYEKKDMIFSAFVNHAHNEYLEIALEGGAIAIALMTVYFALLYRAFIDIRRDAFQKAALLSVSFLLIHSLVDYPLRTAALAMTFAYMNAIIFHTGFVISYPHKAKSRDDKLG